MSDTGNPFDVLDTAPVETTSEDSAPDTDGAAPEAAAETASPESTTEPEAATTDPTPQSGEQQADEFAGEIDPENLRRLFKTHPELRDVYYREKAYNALGPVAEYREIKQLLPTVDDARHAIEAMQQLDNLTRALQSSPDQLVESLKQSAPEAYAKIFDSIATRGWQNFWNGVRTNFGADEEVQAAMEVLEAKVLGGKPAQGAKADPLAGDPRLQRLEQMESQVRQAEVQRYQQTVSSIDSSFRSTVEQEVRSIVGTPQGMNPKLVDRIVNDVVDEVGKAFRNTPTNLRALQPLAAQAAQGQITVDKILDAMMSRARPHIRDIGARTLREWTATVVGTANQRVAAAKGQRTDVGAGTTAAPAAPSLGNKRGEDFWGSVLGLD